MIDDEILGFPILYIIAISMAFAIGLDFHHGYWIDSISRILRRSKGPILTVLRLVQSFLVMLLSFQLVKILFGDSLDKVTGSTAGSTMISTVVSTVSAIVVMLVMLRKDKGFSQMVAFGLQGAKEDLVKTIRQEVNNSISSLANTHKEFLDIYDKRLEKGVSRCSDLVLDRDYLVSKINDFLGRFDSATKTFLAAADRLSEKEEKTDLQREEFRIELESLKNILQSSEATETPDDENQDTKLTSEEGRINRNRGFEAQNELADIIRSWGLMARVGYNKGIPDFKVLKNDKLAVVIACKAFSLSEGGTKQRRIDRDDILAEFLYAKQKKVPLVLSVKNLITGRWWMHWVPAEEIGEFEGLSTPVILGEDSNEAASSLEESVTGVREKLQGVANA